MKAEKGRVLNINKLRSAGRYPQTPSGLTGMPGAPLASLLSELPFLAAKPITRIKSQHTPTKTRDMFWQKPGEYTWD